MWDKKALVKHMFGHNAALNFRLREEASRTLGPCRLAIEKPRKEFSKERI